ncbi:histidine kinase [Plantactinospora sp. B24E8]|uniref:sensor histidine kinase n=1 Tax=Plantactinospora sp. B24E8 TaxID=3153567 RepID=UPI00325E31B9
MSDLVRGRRDLLLDVLIWAALSGPIGWALLSPPSELWTTLRSGGGLLVMAVAVLVSRRAPLLSLVIVVVSTLADGNFVFAIPVMSYLVGWRTARAAPAAFVFGAIALGGTILNLGLLRNGAEMWYLLATTLVFGGVLPWLFGRYRGQHQALVLAGWEQAELLERERRGVAERIRMRERARIAQDIHDSLGHDLSLIALRAGALELAPDLDERHRRAAGEVRASVTLATDRLRQVIGVLREDAEPASTRPAGEGISELVERCRAAGMSVRLLDDRTQTEPSPRNSGEFPSGSNVTRLPAGVPPLVDRTAYRVVQEALTNANRHAPGATVTVRLGGADRTVVRVVNGPPPAGPVSGVRSGGTGLLGLREWVRMAGGTLRAGPVAGGFEVVAELPHEHLDGRVAAADPGLAGGLAFDADRPDHGVAVDGHGRDGGDPDDDPSSPEVGPVAASTERLRRARRQVRRSLLTAVAVPAVIVAGLTLAYYPIATTGAVLDSAEFDRIRLGQQRAELRDDLPRRQVAPPAYRDGESEPAGAACEYYTDGNFPMGQVVYRLCFLDGRLVSKDRVPG